MSGSGFHQVADVEAAVLLAQDFRREGRYDWFRGQVEPWPAHSSLYRRWLADQGAPGSTREYDLAMETLGRFEQWANSTPEAQWLTKDPDVLLSVAQHYGIPTPLIDFSTSPEVAGFFATDFDGDLSGKTGVIWCLSTSDLQQFFEEFGPYLKDSGGATLPRPEQIILDVPGLWRLQAQHGTFLHCAYNWGVHYDLDGIFFPQGAKLSYPSKADIYPDRKSQLEILLDQFFSTEHRRQGLQAMLAFNVRHLQLQEAEPSESLRQLPPHASWLAGHGLSWHAVSPQIFTEAERATVKLLYQCKLSATQLRSSITAGLVRVLEAKPGLRRHHVDFQFTGDDASPAELAAPLLHAGLRDIWDGMRSLPYTNSQLAGAIGTWVSLHRLLPEQCRLQSPMDRMVQSENRVGIHDALFGPSREIELGVANGSCSQAEVGVESLVGAIRDDLAEHSLSEEECRQLKSPSAIQVLRNPTQLFDLEKLTDLFAAQIIPSQMLRPAPHYFNPAALNCLGLP